MIRRPPRSTRTDTLFPTRRSSDLRRDGLPVPSCPSRSAIQLARCHRRAPPARRRVTWHAARRDKSGRSEEHTSELQSLMRISYAVFCLKKKKNNPFKDKYIYKHTQKLKLKETLCLNYHINK